MIRRSFFQILTGLLLPVPGAKAVSSTTPVPSGVAALLASLARSAVEPASAASAAPQSTIDPAFVPGATESQHSGKAITTHAPASPPVHAPSIPENGGHRCITTRLAPNPDPEWLREWQSIPRLEVREDDLPLLSDSHQRALAAEILMRIRGGRPFAFRYLGGSTPGEIRRVLPTSLFGLDLASHYHFLVEDPTEFPEPADDPLYLLAWCQTRNAPRTFRLDRILPA